MTKAHDIYYLPGRESAINQGLGLELLDRGHNLAGREMSGTFARLQFQDQIDLIAQDIQNDFWTETAQIIAVSYGAYLLLHALSALDPYPGQILLLSPILGGATSTESMRFFRPPRADRLMALAEEGSFPIPARIEIHVGEDDWQSQPDRVSKFSIAVGGIHKILPNVGHNLEKPYVRKVLDNWCDSQHSVAIL
jgi:hypothetical protein